MNNRHKTVDNKVSLINKETTIHVLDIDAALTKDEVESAIKISVGNREAQSIRMKSMRPSRDGNQIATVQTSRVAGNVLLNETK
ncbi:hypothetical protein QE152_g33384 [Popillia japonica]|uniref:Uncharacterized protein n=1 Tax=Popillia japonica TaxID=7064 RepID=A0AAW1IX11_POPJA